MVGTRCVSRKIEEGDLTGTSGVAGVAGVVPPGGAAPWSGWNVWFKQIPAFRCPSDPGILTTRGTCNYAFCRGDSYALNGGNATNRDSATNSGLFAANTCYGIADCVDGTSNTVAFSERVQASFGINGKNSPDVRESMLTNVGGITTSAGACLAAAAPIISGSNYTVWTAVKGKFSSIWQDGQPENVAFTTVLGPNAPSCTNDANGNADSAYSILSPSSRHTGGVHCLMADGAVRFVGDSIDTGNLGVAVTASSGKSPYGVWGALGTKGGGETVGEF